MMIMWQFFELLMTCADAAFFLLIPAFQLGYKEWANKKYIFFYVLFYIGSTILYNNLTTNSVSVIFLTLFLLVFYAIFFIRGKYLLKLFWLLFPLALLYGIELTSSSFLIYFHEQITLDVFSLPNLYRFQFCLLVKILQLSLLCFLLRTKLHFYNFSYTVLLPVTVLSFASLFFMSYVQFQALLVFDRAITGMVLLRFAVVFLLVNVSYLVLIAWLNKQHQAILYQQLQAQQNKHQQLLGQQLEMHQIKIELKNHEELAATQECLKRFQEEVKENLQSLWELAKIYKIPHFEKYLAHISRINQSFNYYLCRTGDDVIDSILISKEAVANLHHILLRTQVDLPPANHISSIDLGTILINLLDNSIAALQNLVPIDGVDRMIDLKVSAERNYYEIIIKNPTDDRNHYFESELTTFSPLNTNGLGLKIVKGLVDKYRGDMKITHKDFFFTVHIKLPLNISLSKEDRYAGETCCQTDPLHAQ